MKPVTPLLVADVVIHRGPRVVLIRRGNPPFQGSYALPGGFVDVGETVEGAARREAREETGLRVSLERLVGVYSDPRRDPRGHSVAVAYLARPRGGHLRGGDDAAEARWFPLERLPPLAFDHRRIVSDAIRLMRRNS